MERLDIDDSFCWVSFDRYGKPASMRWSGAARWYEPRGVLGIALAISLLGITTATAAHEHVRGAEYSQNCAICAVAQLPQQVEETVKLAEPDHLIHAVSDVDAHSTPVLRRPSRSRLSRAPPA